MESGNLEFQCPACCELQGVKYAFDLRFKGPPTPKQLPSSRRVAALLHKATSLSVEVEEAGLLQKALARCRAWQCRVVPNVLSAVAKCDDATPPCLALSDGELEKLLDEGER